MHYSRSFGGGDIVAKNHPEGALAGVEPRKELLVAHAFKFRSLDFAGKDFIFGFAVEPCSDQVFRDNVSRGDSGIRIRAAHLHIVDLGADAESAVAGKSPRGGRPGKEIQIILAHDLKLHAAGSVFHVAITAGLVEFVRTQARSGSGAEGLDALAFVQITLFVDILQEIPEGLDVTVIVRDVRVVHIHPVTDALSERTPLGGVFHNLLAAGFVVFFYTDFSADVFLRDAEFLLHSKFHGKAMGVPAGAATDLETALRLVPADGVLDAARHNVVYAGHTVRAGRTFEEDELGSALSHLERALEGFVLLPPFQHLCRCRHEVQTLILFKSHFFYLILSLQI